MSTHILFRNLWAERSGMSLVAAGLMVLFLVSALLSPSGPVLADEGEEYSQSSPAETRNDSPPSTPVSDVALLEGLSLPPLKGPKKTIAVGAFESAGKLGAKYGAGDVGEGLSAMLTAVLIETDRFIVVERAALQELLQEMEMAVQKISKAEGTMPGRVIGANYIIKGAVTEFEPNATSNAPKIGFKLGGSIPFGGSMGASSETAHVALDLRLIDTATSQVIATHRSEGKAQHSGMQFSIETSQLSFANESFQASPLGKATRKALRDAVVFIVGGLDAKPWKGRVVDVEGGAGLYQRWPDLQRPARGYL